MTPKEVHEARHLIERLNDLAEAAARIEAGEKFELRAGYGTEFASKAKTAVVSVGQTVVVSESLFPALLSTVKTLFLGEIVEVRDRLKKLGVSI